jgi:hypothetical protein
MAKTPGKTNVNFTNDNLNTSFVFEGGLGPKGGLKGLAGLITDGISMVRRDGFRELVSCSSEKQARETMDWILSNVWPRDVIFTFAMIDSNGRRVFLSFSGPDALQNARFSKRLFLEIQKNAIFVAEQIRRMQYQCRYLAALVPFYLDRLYSIVNEVGEYQRFIDSEINRLVHSRNQAQPDSPYSPSSIDATEKAMNPVNTWVKQTGFQAPSPLTPTKGSKGLLGNCSTAGQVVTGLVVGGAIFALYKTCKK